MKNFGVYQIENFLNFSKMVLFFTLAQTSGPQWPFSTNPTFFGDTLYIIFKIYSFILVTYSNITGNIFSFSIQKNLIIVHRQYYRGQYYAIEQEQSIWPPPYCSMGEIIYVFFYNYLACLQRRFNSFCSLPKMNSSVCRFIHPNSRSTNN